MMKAMQHRCRRPLFLLVVLVVVVLLASAWTPRRESLAAATGPVRAVFRPLTKVSGSGLASVAAVMHRRLVSLGDGTSTASAANGVINVLLVDVTDPATVLAVLSTPGNLDIRPVLCEAPLYHYAAARGSTAPTAQSSIPVCASPYRFSSADYQNPNSVFNFPNVDPLYSSYPTTLPADDSPSRVVIMASKGQLPSPRVVLGPAEVRYGGKTQLVTGTIIKSASAQLDTSNNQWQVIFYMTGPGTGLFNADARLYYGTPLADDLDGTIVSAPIIEATSFPGAGQVSGNFSKESAVALAAELNSGALPVDVERASTSR
jgi:preprotein translocase subunit SecD